MISDGCYRRKILVAVLSISLFPNLFKDMIRVGLNMSETEYEKLLRRFYQKLFGMTR